ncbi:FCD domain-containing protein [Roseibium algae]|uniref:FCD domain-containing protein n=1 Tax=Roseibium algae TaxID=3123038 RepID=A0ABU8TPN2_9HYPH
MTSKLEKSGRKDQSKLETSGGRDVVERLRSDIVSSVYEPETRLKFADLTKRYDVGIGTLREGLSQLVSEGFVTLEAGKGFTVAPVSREELIEITAHFIELEKRAIADSIAHGDDDWESQVVAAHHRLSIIEKLPWSERMERHTDWVKRHRDFHESIVAACQGKWLFRLRSLMFDQLDRYRFLTKMAPQGLGARKFEEHQRIMDAALARDTDLAVKLIEDHISDTSDRVVTLL